MKIKWLHLSDIHFNYKNYNSHSLRKDFLNRIRSLDQTEPFTHLFITGDILFGNKKADSDTIEFIQELIGVMNLSKENVFVIPGNHDHDRQITIDKMNCILSGKKKKEYTETIDNIKSEDVFQLLDSFSNYNEVYRDIFEEDYYDLKDNPHLVNVHGGVSIVKINTSWLDVDSKQKSNYLRIGTRLLQKVLSSNEQNLKETVNIAIGHHSLDDMTDEDRLRTLDQFKRHNIGVYFCGHRHKPNINHHYGYDVVEFVAPGGYNDGYSNGGYIWGIIDTETDFYKAEVYGWYNNKWCIESKIDGTDEFGVYYFHTDRFNHNSNIIAIDCKTIGGHISKRDLEKSLNCKNFDVHVYNGPYEDVDGYTAESIKDFSNNIIQLVEKNEIVHIFPLAPIPMLISLGFNLQKNSNITIHQFDRKTESWVLDEQTDGIFVEEPHFDFSNNDVLAVAISTSFEIEEHQIEAVMQHRTYDFIHFKANKIDAGYPLYSKDVDNVLKTIFSVLNSKVNMYKEIHLFAAIPAGMAVELGRRMLATVYNNVYTYQLTNGNYSRSIVINKTDCTGNVVFVDLLGLNNAVKLVLQGNGPCGTPNIGDPENEEYFPMLESLLGTGEHFIVRAMGDSMIDAGIDEGDYIVVRVQPTAENGQIVVALVDNNVTIKRFYKDDENEQIILRPENDSYPDIVLKTVEIQGVAVHVIKKI